MGTIIVDNKEIRNLFNKILNCSDPIQIRKIIIEAKSGKGKTSLLKYLREQCNLYKTICLYIDFKTEDFDSEFRFIDRIIYKLKNHIAQLHFPHYSSCINKYIHVGEQNIIFEKIQVKNSSMGNITLPNRISNYCTGEVTSEFWKDYNDYLSDKKIILLLDSVESAPKTICNWIVEYLITSDLSSNQLYIIVAGQEKTFIKFNSLDNDLKRFYLPNTYPLDEWYKFGEQIHIIDKSYVERCFNCYKGEPFNMCIALRPQGEFDETDR